MYNPLPLSPLRQRIDRLLATLAEAAIDSQAPLGREWIRLVMEQSGWDSRALSSRGRLGAVSDAAALRLLIDLAEQIDDILVDHGADVEPVPSAWAIRQLMAALAAGW